MLAVAPVLAATGADVARTRHEGYRELGAAFKNVNDELKGGSPQVYVLQLSARQIRNVAQQQFNWFPAGSGPQPGVKTRAKVEIWANPGEFKRLQTAFANQANLFFQAAATRDVAKIRAQVKPLGATCASCHRSFRTED
ncbi:c-type cytochrome [Sphingomonas tabacisoli]|uniref:C-type cytochrome n=1 Tax=Sphingomonas tabacisoli TaxID=2249466 RepID=A0ABW4I5E3_9SPHN